MSNTMGMVFFIAGLVLLYLGMQASHSFGYNPSQTLSGAPAARGLWLVLLGLALALVGLFIAFKGNGNGRY